MTEKARSTAELAQADDGKTAGSSLRAALVVAALAAGFAILPRATKGCEGASLDEDAPNFTARVVANGASLARGPAPAASDTPNVDKRAPTHKGQPPPSDAPPGHEAAAPEAIELSSLRGHPVVLDFWATWCGPCRATTPIVNTIAQRYKDKGLVVIGVNTSDEDGLAAEYAQKHGVRFPMVYDARNTIAKAYNVTNLPTLVVVSKTGKIVAIRHGVTSDSALDEIVRRYL
jgi:thiol-disulfide isomerase/thioredoxin